MKRTTTTTHRYDSDGELTETVVVETVEDDSTPNVQPYVQPYVTTYSMAAQSAGVTLNLVRPDDDDGLAGVPAIA